MISCFKPWTLKKPRSSQPPIRNPDSDWHYLEKKTHTHTHTQRARRPWPGLCGLWKIQIQPDSSETIKKKHTERAKRSCSNLWTLKDPNPARLQTEIQIQTDKTNHKVWPIVWQPPISRHKPTGIITGAAPPEHHQANTSSSTRAPPGKQQEHRTRQTNCEARLTAISLTSDTDQQQEH